MQHNLKYKYATLIASLRKVQAMASDDSMIIQGAREKLREFLLQGYTMNTITRACTHMAVITRKTVWFMVKEIIRRDVLYIT